MAAAEEEREIEVRSLTGESVRVRISASKTVGDLKQLISGLAFPSASSFHLFFKGVKLSLHIHVGAVGTGGEDDFLVLIPFAKKQKLQEPGSDSPPKVPKPSPISKFADSAYADMMEELSSLQNDDCDASGVPDQTNVSHSQNKWKMESDGKNARVEDGLYECLWNVLQAPCEDITGGQNCEKLVGILESMSCLRNPRSGRCAVIVGNESAHCSCPAWLQQIVQVFTFMNIYAAVIQVQKKHVISENLRDVMNQLGRHGFKVGFEDVVHLSMLCNEVVCFSDNTTELQHSVNTIVVFNSGRADKDLAIHPKTGGKVIMSKIYNSMKKRETHFKMSLSEALKSFAKRGKSNAKVISMEDLMEFVKEGGVCAHVNNRKRKKSSPATTSCTSSFKPRCIETTQLLPVEMVEHLREGFGSKGQMVHIEIIGARMPSFVEVPKNLSANTRNALEHLGISKLYSHQAESILASLAGKSVVVATMTSSGKSLCYNVPVLEVLSQNKSSCALYLFPTKALAQDQLRGLLKMTDSLSTTLHMGIYDGDTSKMDRSWLCANARLLITNPDMLHVSILPYHRQFSRILSNLRFVVIDEAHAYKGAFGCHTALIIRRLRRLCAHVYGSDPSFIFSTATSANPREHCMELANLSTLELIQNDGSPSSQKLFALWNPSSCLTAVPTESKMDMDTNASMNRNLSPISEVSYLLAEMVQHGLRCIAFCRSRKLTEIVLCYTREILKDVAPDLAESICAYRAGYVAEDRRKIEGEFFSGKLCGIVATNALELGIDVGHVDATLHLGFPGSIASLWQQAGRSGRRERPSLAVYVAFEGPLDQYFMKFPKKLFGGPIECCHIDAENQQVVKQHLICAAFEHPLSLLYDEKYFGPSINDAVTSLKNKGELSFDPAVDSSARIWSYIGREKVPSRCVSIRAIDTVRYKLIDMSSNELLEEIEESKAFFQVHEGAIYLHQGKTYLVKELDLSEKVAFCREADVKYYTKTRDYTDIQVLGGDIAYSASSFKNLSLRTTAQARSCNVTTTWFGFYCIQRGTAKILDTYELSLPQYRYESQAAWIRVSEPIKKLVEEKNLSFRGGLHAASHAVLNVVPLYVRCNLSDLAPECPNPHDRRYYLARILVYDQHPGGTGVSMQIQPYFSQLLEAALDLLTSCHCFGLTGCPNCIQSMACHEYNEDVNKDAAIMILKGVLDSEKAFFSETHGNCENPKDDLVIG